MKIVVSALILALYFFHQYLFAIESEAEELTRAAITVLIKAISYSGQCLSVSESERVKRKNT